MAGPITWRNVNAPQGIDPTRMFENAQRSLNGGFDIANKLIQGAELNDANNWQVQKDNNTQAFLDTLAQYRTPEAIAEAQASGVLDSMRTGYGAQIDRAAARTAQEARPETLYRQATAANAFNDQKLAIEMRPVTQNIIALAAEGKKAEAAALIQANPRLPNAGELMKSVIAGERDMTRFDWDRNSEAQKALLRPLEVQQAQSQLQTAAAQRALLGAQATQARDASTSLKAQTAMLTAADKLDGLQDKSWDRFISASPYASGTYNSPEGRAALTKGMKELGLTPVQVEDTLYNLSKYFKDGITTSLDGKKQLKVPLPISVVLDELAGATDGAPLPFWSRKGDSLINRLEDRFGVESDGSLSKDLTKRDQDLINKLIATNAKMEQRALANASGNPMIAQIQAQQAIAANENTLRTAARKNGKYIPAAAEDDKKKVKN